MQSKRSTPLRTTFLPDCKVQEALDRDLLLIVIFLAGRSRGNIENRLSGYYAI